MSILSKKIEDNIPNGWNVYKASDLFDNYSEKGFPDEKQLMVTQNRGTIYREDGEIDIKVSEESLKGYKLVNKGDFIISLRSFQGGIEYSGLRGIVSPAYTIIRNKKEINHDYYKYLFKSSSFINMLNSAVIGIRDGKQISFQLFKEFPLYYPPLKEQEKIASILSIVDEQIDNVDEIIRKNKKLKKGLMQQLLTKGIGNTKFKKTEVGEIPEHWEVKKMEDIVYDINQGINTAIEKTQFTKSGIPILKAKDINNYRVNLEDVSYISNSTFEGYSDRYKLKYGDILFTNIGSDLGKASIYNKNIECSYAWNVMRIYNKSIIESKFLYYLMNSDRFYKEIKKRVKGTGMGFVSKDSILSIEIQLPSVREQHKISNILEIHDEKIEEYENKKEKLEELKKGLMQQLLTGMIRVI